MAHLISPTALIGARPTDPDTIKRRYVSAADLDLAHACDALLNHLPPRTAPASTIKLLKRWAATSTKQEQQNRDDVQASSSGELGLSIAELCEALRELLLIPSCAQPVAITFHPILLHLLAPFISETEKAQADWSSERTKLIFIMLGLLLGPFEEIFP